VRLEEGDQAALVGLRRLADLRIQGVILGHVLELIGRIDTVVAIGCREHGGRTIR
jgi:hypothetical protein